MDSVFNDQSIVEVVAKTSFWDKLLSRSVTVFIALCLFSYFLYQAGRPFAQRYFFLPPTDFRTTLKAASEKPNGIVASNKVGIKKASFRRRMIMGSLKPQLYSTLPLNSIDSNDKKIDNTQDKYYRLKVAKIDRMNEANQNHFLMNIKPIDVTASHRKKLFGFFHPFSYALGGGEKVLWEAVVSTLENDSSNIAVIYTFTPSTDSSIYSILNNVRTTFGIDLLTSDNEYLRDRIVFIHLPDKYQWLIKGESYKFFSMIGQAIGSILLVVLGFQQVAPDIFVDTIGVPFSYFFVFGFLDLPIMSYIHYPTISRDMIESVKKIGGIYGTLKSIYWQILLKIYAFNIMWVDIALYNSTWTKDNIMYALNWTSESENQNEYIVYPPCVSYSDKDSKDVEISEMVNHERERNIVYLAQFRPEKRHLLLLSHYKEYLKSLVKEGIEYPHKLVLIGSTRSQKDEEYVGLLKRRIDELEISKELVIFELNLPTSDVELYLQNSDYGINCMWKEHFGIAVVEYMLQGAIPLAHASAGPLKDIVLPYINNDHVITKQELNEKIKIEDSEVSGYLFKDETDPDHSTGNVEIYPTLTEILVKASKLSEDAKQQVRSNAINVARQKFGRGVFSSKWTQSVYEISKIETERRELRSKVEKLY